MPTKLKVKFSSTPNKNRTQIKNRFSKIEKLSFLLQIEWYRPVQKSQTKLCLFHNSKYFPFKFKSVI